MDGVTDVREAVGAVETVAALRSLADIDDALVTDWPAPDGGRLLVAHVSGPDLDPVQVRRRLLAVLPGHLVPDRVAVLDVLPLTREGLYDLGALPDPVGPAPDPQPAAGVEYLAPRTPLEQQLADAVRELLGTERVGVGDSFFALGGSSLQAFQLMSRIQDLYDVELALPQVMAAPTVEGMAELVVRTLAEQRAVARLRTDVRRTAGQRVAARWRRFHGGLPLGLRSRLWPGVACGGDDAVDGVETSGDALAGPS